MTCGDRLPVSAACFHCRLHKQQQQRRQLIHDQCLDFPSLTFLQHCRPPFCRTAVLTFCLPFFSARARHSDCLQAFDFLRPNTLAL